MDIRLHGSTQMLVASSTTVRSKGGACNKDSIGQNLQSPGQTPIEWTSRGDGSLDQTCSSSATRSHQHGDEMVACSCKTCDGAGETTPREHQGADSSVWAVDRNKEEGLADYDGAGGKLRWLASRVKKRREEDHDDSSRPYDEEKTKRDAGGGSRHCFPTTGAGGFDATPGGG